MTTSEYVEFLIQAKRELQQTQAVDEEAAKEAARLLSGSMVYPLYGALWQYFYDMEAITEHLESLYDSENHIGLIYFILILADSVELTLPLPFYIMSTNGNLMPILSSAIIEDWLEYDTASEVLVTD